MALKYRPTLNTLYIGQKDPYHEILLAPLSYQGVSLLQEENGAYPLILLLSLHSDLRNILLSSYGLQTRLLDEDQAIELLWLLSSMGFRGRFTPGDIEYLPLEVLRQRLSTTLILTPKQQQKVQRYSRGVALFALLTKTYVPHGYGPWEAPSGAALLVNLALAHGLMYQEEGEWQVSSFSLSSFTSWHEVSPIDALAAHLHPTTLFSIAGKYGMHVPSGSLWLGLFTLLQRLGNYRSMLLRPILPLPPPLSGEVFPPFSEEGDQSFEIVRREITMSTYSDSEIETFYQRASGSHWWYNPDYLGVITYGIPHPDPSLQMRTTQIYTARELEASFRSYSGPLNCKVRRFLVPRGGSASAFSSAPSFNIYSLSELWAVTGKVVDDHDVVSLHQHLTAQLQSRRRENWALVSLLEKPRGEGALEILVEIFLQGMWLRGWLGPGYEWPYIASSPQREIPLIRRSLNLPLLAFDWFTGFINTVSTDSGLSLERVAFLRQPHTEVGEILVNTAFAYLYIWLFDLEQINLYLEEGERRLQKELGIEAPIYHTFRPELMR